MQRVLYWLVQFINFFVVAHDFAKTSSQECNIKKEKLHELLKQCRKEGLVEPRQNNVKKTDYQRTALNIQTICKKEDMCQHENLCENQYALELHCFGSCWGQCNTPKFKKELQKAKCCMEVFSDVLKNNSHDGIVQAIVGIEKILEEINVNETTSLFFNNAGAVLYKPTGVFKGLEIHANEKEAKFNVKVPNSKVKAGLPRELEAGENNTILFCMVHFPNQTALKDSDKLYDRRLFGLSVHGRNISKLEERVNITITLDTNTTKTHQPQCVFLNTSTNGFSSDGCLTLWEQNQTHVTCSCNHLTYFGVLMMSVPEDTVSPTDQKILSYITIIGCSISLFALLLTVLIFITNRKLRVDDSKKIHISLTVALILLNLHFLPSEAVAASSLDGLCLYMALGLHYSLLATFSWMALEGLHLYLLLVKVFNIYVRGYLLKLSLVGWGVPAVIVSVVVIINKDYYGHAPVDKSNPNGSEICYITHPTVKTVTTLGFFSLVFLFNVIMFGVTVKCFVAAHFSGAAGQRSRNAAKREICTLLSVMVLLGITWGLNFFLYDSLTTPGLYVFCILNSMQGIFIFIYFVLSLEKTKDSADMRSTITRTTSISTKT